MKVNQRELAELVGVSVTTLKDWQREGMPVERREISGMPNQYDTATVIAWLIRRAIDKAQVQTPRDRLDTVRADIEELNLRDRLAEVANLAEIGPAIGEFHAHVTAEFDGIADRYIDQMEIAASRPDKFQLFRRIAREVRERLSRFEFRASTDSENGRGDG